MQELKITNMRNATGTTSFVNSFVIILCAWLCSDCLHFSDFINFMQYVSTTVVWALFFAQDVGIRWPIIACWLVSFGVVVFAKPKFGICFDIDGVLARGTEVLDAALKAFKKLVDRDNHIQVPVVFVTNALNRNIDKATQLSSWLGVKVQWNTFDMCASLLDEETGVGLINFNPKNELTAFFPVIAASSENMLCFVYAACMKHCQLHDFIVKSNQVLSLLQLFGCKNCFNSRSNVRSLWRSEPDEKIFRECTVSKVL